ncbi:iron-containing alcohol dehydrogenase [candidate division KSB1 bacterium]
MENFIAYNPTKLHFGKDVLNGLGRSISKYGKRVLLVYGKGSIKKNGIYEKVMKQLDIIHAKVFEYEGIKPNPIIEDVNAAAEIGRKNDIELILAVGGGSVIDSAKIISIAIPVHNDAWDFYKRIIKPQRAVPLICVLTLAATGTEMNPFSVVQNHATNEKLGFGNDYLYPRHSFLDPQNTLTVPRDYTAYGIMDLISHCLEAYFGAGDATLSDRFIISIIKEAMEYGPQLLENLNDYELRAKIMFAATMALNRITLYGKVSGDWGVHSIGHVISLLYDVPHGATLSIATIAWMNLLKEKLSDRLILLGQELFNTQSPDGTIKAFESFFHKIECPIKLSEIGIDKDKRHEIYETMMINEVSGTNFKISESDFNALIGFMI